MIRHIVAWKFKETAGGAGKEENLRRAKEVLEQLKPRITAIRAYEVGVDVTHADQSYDLVVVSEFDSRQSLAAYQEHPDHRRAVEFLRTVHEGRVVVDYEF